MLVNIKNLQKLLKHTETVCLTIIQLKTNLSYQESFIIKNILVKALNIVITN